MLDGKETKESLRAGFPADRKPYTRDYDYEDDSDLEEDEDWDSSDVEDFQVAPEKEENNHSDYGTAFSGQNPGAKGNESPDIIFVPDADPLSLDSVDTKAQAGIAVAPTPTHVGTVVVIDDAAFVTWVFFLL